MEKAFLFCLILVICVMAVHTATKAKKQKPDLCPDAWDLMKTSCIGFLSVPANWTEAQRICRSHNGHLLTLDTEIKKKNWEEIRKKAIAKGFSAAAWTSAHIQAGYLVWDDKAPHLMAADKDGYHLKSSSKGNHYWKWNSSHPVDGECVLLEPIVDSTLNNPKPLLQLMNCADTNQFICTRDAMMPNLKINYTGCPANWYSNAELNKCFTLDSMENTSANSEAHCIGLKATMASPDSLMEIKMIQNLLPTIGHNAEVWVKPPKAEIQQRLVGPVRKRQQLESSECYKIGVDTLRLQAISCDLVASTICQVPKDYGVTSAIITSKQESFVERKDIKKIIQHTLTCQATKTAENTEPVFTKDGLPIDRIKFNPQIRGMAQGCYRCEVWNPETFSLLTSTNYVCIHLKDTLTYRGELLLHISIAPKDQTLFNILRQLSGNVIPLSKYMEYVVTGGIKSLNFARRAIKKNDIKVDIRQLISPLKRVTSANTMRVKFDVYVDLHGFEKTYQSDMSIYEQLRKHIIHQINTLQQPVTDHAALAKVLKGDELVNEIYPVQGSFVFKSTAYCFAKTLFVIDTPDFVNFPHAAVGGSVNSTEACKGEVEGENSPRAKAVCQGSFEEGTNLVMVPSSIIYNCVEAEPNYGESYLNYVSELLITGKNVKEITNKVAQFTMDTDNLSPSDVNSISNVLENIASFDDIDVQIGDPFCQTISNMMDVTETILNQADTEVPARILHSLDRYTHNVKLGQEPEYQHNLKNLAVRLFDLKPDAQSESLATGIQLLSGDDEDDDDSSWNQGVTVLRGGTAPTNNAENCLTIPLEVVQSRIVSGNKTRLSFMIQRDTALYLRTNVNKTADKQLTLNSRIISASLGERRIKNLSNRVSMIFQPLQMENVTKGIKVSCVFWDYAKNDHNGGWSNEGCKHEKIDDLGRYLCSCNHLTNFAVLMDLSGTAHLEEVLEIITYVGLSLSIVGLVLTIGSFILFKKIRKGRPQRTLLNLAIALLCTYIVFLFGIDKVENDAGCIAVAVLLHYFLLVAFMWMLMEALLQYLRFVKVLGTYIEKFTLKTCLVAWSVPLIPVIILLAIDHRLYRGRETYCFMTLYASYFAVILPIALILLINFIVFSLVLWSILRRSRGLQTNQSQRKMTIINIYAGIACALLLGLSWIFAFMAVDKAETVFRIIFTLLNTLHGFFIFLFFTLREKVVRNCWRDLLCPKKKDKGSTFVAYSHTPSKPSASYDTSSSSNDVRRLSDTQTSSSAIVSSDPGDLRKRNSSGGGSTVMFNNGLAILPAEEEAIVFHNKSYA